MDNVTTRRKNEFSGYMIDLNRQAILEKIHRYPISREHVELGAILGVGAYGVVRLATLKPDVLRVIFGESYAARRIPPLCIKEMGKQKLCLKRQLEHVRNEITILSELRHHPFITPIYGVTQDARSVYLLMECIQGGELFSLLETHNYFNASISKFYVAQVVIALEYLHKIGIAYRDLKPENILISMQGNIKVTDFGVAKRIEGRTFSLVGTPEYMAPEQVTTGVGHDHAVDWWALGILLYEMMVGSAPFADEGTLAIYRQIKQDNPTFPDHLDLFSKDLISRLLVKDKSRRYGCLVNGAGDIKRHKFFRGLDWNMLTEGRYRPPWRPQIRADDAVNKFFEHYDEDEYGLNTEITIEEEAQFDWLISW